MAGLTKPTVRLPWASAAASSSIVDPDTITPGYAATGYPLSTQPPARQFWNWVLNYCMNGVRYFSQRGVPDWDTAETYYIGAVVQGTDGVVRQSLTNNNIGNPPPTSSANWGGLSGYALTGTLNGYVTATQLATALSNYPTNTTLSQTLANYATEAQLASSQQTAIGTSENYTNASLQGYVSNGTLASTLGSYVKTTALNTALGSYLTTTQIQTAYYTASTVNGLLSSYYTAIQISQILSGYASNQALTNGLAAIATRFGSQSSGCFKIGAMYVNFGTVTLGADPQAFEFNTTFPSACVAIIPCGIEIGAGGIPFFSVSNPASSVSQFTASSSINGSSFCFIALGY